MDMKYAFFTGSSFSIPAIQFLLQENKLACVVLVEPTSAPDQEQLRIILQQNNIPIVQYSSMNENAVTSELDKYQASRAIVFLFRHKLSSIIINFFGKQIFNIHPSDLPNYRGAMPLYWQLRNNESQSQLTLHRLTQSFDSGDISVQTDINIHPFDTLQSLNQKVSQLVPNLLAKFLEVEKKGQLKWRKQSESTAVKSAPLLKQQDLILNWQKHTARDIAAMARAGNVDFGGVLLPLNGGVYQVLQATEINNEVKGVPAGTIIEVSLQSGLVVSAIHGAVSLDIVASPQGVFDGYRFALLFGLDAGLCLLQRGRRQ